jgi:hypothetical protein
MNGKVGDEKSGMYHRLGTFDRLWRDAEVVSVKLRELVACMVRTLGNRKESKNIDSIPVRTANTAVDISI